MVTLGSKCQKSYNNNFVAPCVNACPAHIDIPRYCSYIAQGQFDDALAVIREKIPFPSVCGSICFSPCESQCNLNSMGGAMMIKALKRFVAERDRGLWRTYSVRKKRSGKRVAIIGAGPCGLTAGYYLAKLGHDVFVYEALPLPGGMLRYGIPEYRLPLERLSKEIEIIQESGVEIKTNTIVTSVQKVLKEGYEALFISIGCHKNNSLGIEGEKLEGVVSAIDFLRKMRMDDNDFKGQRVAVIGGGNAAIDSARSALRSGAKDVYVIYRRSRDEMPAYPEEVKAALEEGINFHYLAIPKRILGTHGKVTGVECCRMKLGAIDDSGRRRPFPIKDSGYLLDVDSVIISVGQSADTSFMDISVEINKNATILADCETLATNVPGVFAGGDAVTQPASVIKAIASGRKAAASIDKYLGGEGIIEEQLVSDESTDIDSYSRSELVDRAKLQTLPLENRTNSFFEVEYSLSEEEAIRQSKRCLRCDMPIVVYSDRCCGCHTCEMRCSFSYENAFNPSKAKIQVRRVINKQNMEFNVTLTEECNNCGICVTYCPYGALIRKTLFQD